MDVWSLTKRQVSHTYKHLRRAAQQIFRSVAPLRYWRIKLGRLATNELEREADLLPILVSPDRVSVDVGAANGDYVARLVRLSPHVVAFEPRKSEATALTEMAHVLGLSVRVESVALSDSDGVARFRILRSDGGRSTIEAGNPLGKSGAANVQTVEVKTRTLDDMGIGDIGFMKIDVEGHEVAVLRGARKTISDSRCSLLIEAEDRHAKGSPTQVISWMAELDYAGYFLIDDRLTPAERFDPSQHQRSADLSSRGSRSAGHTAYVNNFIFVPIEKRDAFLSGSAELGFHVSG